jgi:carbamoyl-phosphate synthase large subunit
VIGLMNAQFAIREDEVYVLEVNPRASRTVPFVSKATGVPLAAIAAKVMGGKSLKEQGYIKEIIPNFFSIKEAVFPFMKFQGVDPILGPEMRSTGEVMGIGWSFGGARAKSMKGANYGLPKVGKAFLSVRDGDKNLLVPIARELVGRGFQLVATRGTCEFLTARSIPCEEVNKVLEGRPHIVDLIKNNEINFIVNTTEGRQAISDSFSIRREALQRKLSYSTTIAGGMATLRALDHAEDYTVQSLQQLHRGLEA